MKPWKWMAIGTIGVVLYLLFLLVSAPADFFTGRMALLTNNAVILQQAEGSLWRGNAALQLPRLDPQPLGRLHWTLHPLRLFTGQLGAELALSGNDIDARAVVSASRGRYTLRDTSASIPPKLLALLFPLADVLGLSGQFRLSATTLELDRQSLVGDAEIIWSNAASRLLPLNETGEYRLRVSAKGKRATLTLSTVRGPLQIVGQGEWRLLEDGVFNLQGSITPSPPQPALDPLLNAIGPAQANGARAFNIETRMRPLDTSQLF